MYILVRLAPFVAFLFYFLLFSDEHNDDVQYHVEEDNLGIGILVDHRLAFIEKVENIDNVGLVDEAGEVLGEVLLFLCHIDEFFLMEVVHKTLSEHVGEVVEHALLLFAVECRHDVAPFLQVVYLAHVRQSHQHDKEVEELLVFVSCIEFLQRLVPVAIGNSCHAVCCVPVESPSLNECLLKFLSSYLLEVDTLGTASDGFEQQLGLLAYQEEKGLSLWFLQELQHLVGALYVHALWQPDQADFITSLA